VGGWTPVASIWRPAVGRWTPEGWIWRPGVGRWTPVGWIWRPGVGRWTPVGWIWRPAAGRWTPVASIWTPASWRWTPVASIWRPASWISTPGGGLQDRHARLGGEVGVALGFHSPFSGAAPPRRRVPPLLLQEEGRLRRREGRGQTPGPAGSRFAIGHERGWGEPRVCSRSSSSSLVASSIEGAHDAERAAWKNTSSPVVGSVPVREAGKRYCQARLDAACGIFSGRASGSRSTARRMGVVGDEEAHQDHRHDGARSCALRGR
jgi:hypothetical protein